MSEIFINVITVPEGKLDEAVIVWRKISDMMEASPHCTSTKLHQDKKHPNRLVNYAIHPSMEAFFKISKSEEFLKLSNELTELKVVREPGVFEIIHSFG